MLTALVVTGDGEFTSAPVVVERAHWWVRLVDVVVTHWPPTLHALHPIYAHGIGTEALLNRYFINDEPRLVEQMGPSGGCRGTRTCRTGPGWGRRSPSATRRATATRAVRRGSGQTG